MKLRRVDFQKKCKKKNARKQSGVNKLKPTTTSYAWGMSATDALKVSYLH